MSMRLKNFVSGVMLAVLSSVLTLHFTPASTPAAQLADPPANAALAEPGVEHAGLCMWQGRWFTETRSWSRPGAETQRSRAMVTMEPVLGGRYLLERVEGTVLLEDNPLPFQAIGILGFDNATKRYVSAWVDTMSTSMVIGAGTVDPTGSVMTIFATVPDSNGGNRELKAVRRMLTGEKHVLELYHKLPEGIWFKGRETVATRERPLETEPETGWP